METDRIDQFYNILSHSYPIDGLSHVEIMKLLCDNNLLDSTQGTTTVAFSLKDFYLIYKGRTKKYRKDEIVNITNIMGWTNAVHGHAMLEAKKKR